MMELSHLVTEPERVPIWAHLIMMGVGGLIVWLSGTRLSVYADAISEKTGMGQAFVGALLLGGATSLPELATTLTAASIGNASLAVNNIFGGIAMQFMVLAMVDLICVQGALTYFSPQPVLMLGGVLLILLIAMAMAALSMGEVASIGAVGLWPVMICSAYVISLWFMQRFENRQSWIPAELPEERQTEESETAREYKRGAERSGLRLGLLFALNASLVLIGGWAVSVSGDVIAKATPLGSGFVGATLVALMTSLPEISTTVGAVRVHAYTMAVSSIVGTNSVEVALLFPADLAYRDGLIIDSADPSALFVAAIGIIVTCLYLWGILERRNRTFLRMGTDSAWVCLVYLGGLVLLYQMSSP